MAVGAGSFLVLDGRRSRGGGGRLLEATDRRDVVLVGHWSGAQSALRTALTVADRIVGMVLAGPTLDAWAPKPAVLLVRFSRTVAGEKLSELSAVLPWYVSSGVCPGCASSAPS